MSAYPEVRDVAGDGNVANEETTEDQGEGAARKGPGAVVWLMVLMVCASSGFAVAFVLAQPPAEKEKEKEAPPVPFEMLNADQTMVLPFGDVTVNLDEGRMNRYLRLKISVLIAKEEELLVTEAIAAQNAVLKNWLLSHLSDKTLEEIRGKAGQNMLRREIRRQFNETMFTDRRDRIYDVLFEEFNVQ
ncbi:MAG: flagellar basal body-associated FliL family protein [Planctomycetaceae bacterium]